MRYLEDIPVGEKTDFGSHTVTAEEIRTFARAYDPQPFHVDEEAARRSHFGGLVASGWHTAALWMGHATRYRLREAEEQAARGEPVATHGPSPGFKDLRWLKPVYAGDTLSFATEIIDVRPLRSKPDFGIITSRNTATNQKGELVYSFVGTVFVQRRPG